MRSATRFMPPGNRVGLHASVGCAVAEEAVVDVDMVVSGITESGRNEGFGLPYDKRVGNVDSE